MPYNVESKNPDTKWDGLVDKKLSEQDAAISLLLKRVQYLESRVK